MARARIRLIRTHNEFRQCERIQKLVWGTLGVASEAMIVAQKYGGVVLGSLLDGRVVGFLFAFLARRGGRIIHWSHMMAVEPGLRDLSLGFRMKLAHRRLALERGLKSICWTYDPLQSRNAALNLYRLGAIVREFIPDLYGRFPSRIERGLPSDRFVVDWPIGSRAVERRLKEGRWGAGVLGRGSSPEKLIWSLANDAYLGSRGLLENRQILLGLRKPRLLVEIPANTDEIRRRSVELARRWRFESRRIFKHYFAAGYRVADFIPPGKETDGRCFYVLRRGNNAYPRKRVAP